MKFFTFGFLATLTTWNGDIFCSAAERTFKDDRGVTHTFDGDKATIVTFAHMAVGLSHLGMDNKQILGTYGEYANSGSDMNFTDFTIPSSYPADPSPEDMVFLQTTKNLSPSCVAQYCTEFNLDTLKELKPDFLLAHGYTGGLWAIGAVEKNITDMGITIIYNEISLGHPTSARNCTEEKKYKDCSGKTMIDEIEQLEEISVFLGHTLPESVEADKKLMCKAAADFTSNAKKAQEKGVRVLAGYLTLGTSYMANPITDMVLRMFEELGAPMMHYDKCESVNCTSSYFWEFVPIDDYFSCKDDRESCNDDVLYPVDFWLYDHRTTNIVPTPEFIVNFPDKALMAKQYAYWPIGGRIVSYRHIAEILNIVGPKLGEAKRLHPATSCTPDVDVSSDAHRLFKNKGENMLKGGDFACYQTEFHETKYLQCPREDASPSHALRIGKAAGILASVVLWAIF